ncbi:MAG: outer membrane lipoprotein carrier protein LolA [Phycisphaerales bacterium]|nr:MAG: outer membrane lipoprotein carrier protein LolA [Phycisphaerales bacterium]
MKRIALFQTTILTFALTGATAALAGDTLESVEKELTSRWNKLKSMSAKMDTLMKIEMQGGSSKTTATGTIEFLNKDGKSMVRMELNSETAGNFGGNEIKSQASTLTISDGEYAHTMSERMGHKMAQKTKADPSQLGDLASQFEMMRKNNDLKLLPEQTIDGHSVYVIEATPKDKPTQGMGKMIMYYAKDTGVPLKMIMHDTDGKTISETTYSDVKVNKPIDPARFVFKAPEGVQVMDMTGR